MSTEYTIVIEKDEDGSLAVSPAFRAVIPKESQSTRCSNGCGRRLHSGLRSRNKTLRVRLNWWAFKEYPCDYEVDSGAILKGLLP